MARYRVKDYVDEKMEWFGSAVQMRRAVAIL